MIYIYITYIFIYISRKQGAFKYHQICSVNNLKLNWTLKRQALLGRFFGGERFLSEILSTDWTLQNAPFWGDFHGGLLFCIIKHHQTSCRAGLLFGRKKIGIMRTSKSRSWWPVCQFPIAVTVVRWSMWIIWFRWYFTNLDLLKITWASPWCITLSFWGIHHLLITCPRDRQPKKHVLTLMEFPSGEAVEINVVLS